ncbi:hypothetical protein D3C86_1882620 [compost metagenome]
MKCIVVGHTILDNNIASYYDGKVIGLNADVHKGKFAALLIEGKAMSVIDECRNRTHIATSPEL